MDANSEKVFHKVSKILSISTTKDFMCEKNPKTEETKSGE